jgi:hypothetical protein
MNQEDQGLTPSRVSDDGRVKSSGGGSEIPPELVAVLLAVGEAEWGSTAELDADGHAEHTRTSVSITAAHFGQTGPQAMHGLYVRGSDTVICHAGTSPNSPQIARALTGAWNRLVADARAQASEASAPQPRDPPAASDKSREGQ